MVYAGDLEDMVMSVDRGVEYLAGLLNELRKLPRETGWVEFKESNSNPEQIGEYISALSNTAALWGKESAYIVWGIQDVTHAVTGTTFRPGSAKKGNEDLDSWLLRLMSPQPHFEFCEFEYEGQHVALLTIPRASDRPVQFQGTEFIRVGSYCKKLKDHPQIERDLWKAFEATPFEQLAAMERVTSEDVFRLIDSASYFDLLELPQPRDQEAAISRLREDGLLRSNQAGGWDILNLGAIAFAKDLHNFNGLKRKTVRIINYDGKGRLDASREIEFQSGYGAGFKALMILVVASLPSREVISQALRSLGAVYPELAVRELVANMLIHQDFGVSGAGPIIEIFLDRVDITNPGFPIISVDRFVDAPPRSRNEALASLMRRIGICEERGTGVDKVVYQTERHHLPAPVFETAEGSTRAVLFAFKPIISMERVERVRACYLHACLKYVERDQMTNASLRERFGIEVHNMSTVSRIIREAIEDGLVKPFDPDQGRKYAKYIPWWA